MHYKNKMGLISSIDIKKGKYQVLYWTIFLILILVAFVCLFPPIWVMLSAVKDVKEFYQMPPTIIPRSFNWDKITDVWQKYDFVKYYINTIVLTLGCIVTSVVMNGLAGYVLSRLKPKGTKLVFGLIMFSMMVPNATAMVPVYRNILNFPILNVNLINTNFPMWIMYGASAFKIIVFKSFFDGLPEALVEAARIDGCGELKIIPKIILPLCIPVVVTMIIVTLREAWSDFFWPYLVLRDKQKLTVMVELFAIQNQIALDELVLLLSFSILPPTILFIFFQKYIIQGFTLSGIKG